MGLRDVLRNNKMASISAAADIAAIATADSKAGALAQTIKGITLNHLVGPSAAVLASFTALSGITQTILRDTNSLAQVFAKLTQIKGLENQFKILTGSIAQAKAKVAELLAITGGQRKFSLGDFGAAAKELQVLTRGAYAGADALREIGDAAHASGNGVDAVAQRAGELHAELRNGQPIRATADALEGMGVISTGAADRLAAMQESGAGLTTTFAAFREELKRSAGALDEHAQSAEGLEAGMKKAGDGISEAFGKAFADAKRKSIQDTTDVLLAMQPVAESLGGTLASLTTPFEGLGTKFAAFLAHNKVLGPVLSLTLTGVKALGAGLLALGAYASVAPLAAFARGLMSVLTTADKGAAAMANLSLAQSRAATAAREVSAGNLAVGASAAAAAARSTGMAAAFGVAAAAGRVLGMVLKGIGLGIVITAVAAGIEALVDWARSSARAAEAARELANANRDVEGSLNRQISTIRNLNDAQDALTASTKQLHEARAKLHALEDAASDGDKNAKAQLPEARTHLATAAGAQASLMAGMRAGKFGVSVEQDAINRRRALRDVELGQMDRQAAIGSASGPAKLVLMEQERDRMQRDAQAGRLAETEHERLNTIERNRLAQAKNETDRGFIAHQMGEARRASESEIVKAEQELQDLKPAKPGVIIHRGRAIEVPATTDVRGRPLQPGALQAQEARVAFLHANISDRTDANERGANEAGHAIRNERRAQALGRADLAAEREIAALRDRGFEREEKTAEARINALKEQRDVELDFGNAQAASEIEPRIAAAERELRLAQERNKLERETIAARLRAAEAENAASVAAARGQFAVADAKLAQAQKIRDAEDDKQSLDRYRDLYGNEDQAQLALGKDQQARQLAREAQADVFRATKGRELEEGRLAASGTGDDARKLTLMQDVDEFRKTFGEASKALGPGHAQEAAGYALQQTQQSIMMQQSPVVASAMQRIGGGGGVADPTIGVQQRIAAIAEEQRELLRALVKQGDGEMHPNEPAKDEWSGHGDGTD
jgi:hypothetical protein